MAAKSGSYSQALGVLATVEHSWDGDDEEGADLTEVSIFFGEVCIFTVRFREKFLDLNDAITQALEKFWARLAE